jgi:hypothetical protein
MKKRPLNVTILGSFFVALGVALFVYHLTAVDFRHPFRAWALWISLSELIWAASGAFMLFGKGWARWLLLLWILFHIGLSFPSFHAVVSHGLLLVLIAVLLFRPEATAFFRQPAKNTV